MHGGTRVYACGGSSMCVSLYVCCAGLTSRYVRTRACEWVLVRECTGMHVRVCVPLRMRECVSVFVCVSVRVRECVCRMSE